MRIGKQNKIDARSDCRRTYLCLLVGGYGGTSGSSKRSTKGSPSDSWTSRGENSAMLMKVYEGTDEIQYAQSVLFSAMRGPLQKRPRVEQPIAVQASQPSCTEELRGHIPYREKGWRGDQALRF